MRYLISVETVVRSVVVVPADSEDEAIDKVLTADVELFNRYGAADLSAGHDIKRANVELPGHGAAMIIDVEPFTEICPCEEPDWVPCDCGEGCCDDKGCKEPCQTEVCAYCGTSR